MKHQLRELMRAMSEAAELTLREAEGRTKELSQSETEDRMKGARERDYAEHRLMLAREFTRAVHVVADNITGDLLGDPVPARDNEWTEDPVYQTSKPFDDRPKMTSTQAFMAAAERGDR